MQEENHSDSIIVRVDNWASENVVVATLMLNFVSTVAAVALIRIIWP